MTPNFNPNRNALGLVAASGENNAAAHYSYIASAGAAADLNQKSGINMFGVPHSEPAGNTSFLTDAQNKRLSLRDPALIQIKNLITNDNENYNTLGQLPKLKSNPGGLTNGTFSKI